MTKDGLFLKNIEMYTDKINNKPDLIYIMEYNSYFNKLVQDIFNNFNNMGYNIKNKHVSVFVSLVFNVFLTTLMFKMALRGFVASGSF